MIKEILEYIPSAPYTYIGGLTLLSELLPLPLPMTSSEVSQAYVYYVLWQMHFYAIH